MIPIWLDCDPGHDDMMAIFLASHATCLDLRGISTTHGNQTVEKTYANAVRTVYLSGKSIPVFKGFAEPLKRKSKACPEIHGESGLGGIDWSEIDKQVLSKQLQQSDQIEQFFAVLRHEIDACKTLPFKIVTTASFTNIARFLEKFPSYASKIELISMAGNFKTIGNIGSWAEFNVLIDPEACQIILDQGVHIVFVPLDVTHQILFTDEVKRDLLQLKNKKFANIVVNLLEFFKESYTKVFGFKYPPVHDPAAIFYLMNPGAFKTEKIWVDIECEGKHTFGACCADWYNQWSNGKKNATVCLDIDADAFWSAMLESLAKCKGI